LLAVFANLGGFLVTVAAGALLTPAFGITAIPLSFAIGSAVKVVLLALALVPRMRTIRPAPTVSEASSAPGR